MTDKRGVAAAVALLGGSSGDILPENTEAQDDLFEAETALPLDPANRGNAGKGRQKGAINRATRKFRDYFLSQYRSPVIGLAEIYSRSPRELAIALEMYEVETDGSGRKYKSTRLRPTAIEDAFRIQIECLKAASPFVEKKQPIEVETDGKGLGVLVLGDLDTDGAVSDELGLGIIDVQANQQVSDAPSNQSDED